MLKKIKFYWEYLQDLLDVNGDVIMLCFSAVILYKIHYHVVTQWDAAVFASAIAAFAYSNKGGPKSL